MAVFRLDKFLATVGVGTRSEVKNLIKGGKITVDGEIVKKPEIKIDTEVNNVIYQGEKLEYVENIYIMLNKPQGVVSATEDNLHATVIDIIKKGKKLKLFPVGRLDKDTEGLLLITNDGDLAHKLLSPKKHVDKVYYVELDSILTDENARIICDGVQLEEDFITMPAKIEFTNDRRKVYITICEGKFHQVKRMFEYVGLTVTFLKRISMGPLKLDNSLKTGEYRDLTDEEIAKLKKVNL